MKRRKLTANFGAGVAGVLALSNGGTLWATQGHALMHDRGTIRAVAAIGVP